MIMNENTNRVSVNIEDMSKNLLLYISFIHVREGNKSRQKITMRQTQRKLKDLAEKGHGGSGFV